MISVAESKGPISIWGRERGLLTSLTKTVSKVEGRRKENGVKKIHHIYMTKSKRKSKR